MFSDNPNLIQVAPKVWIYKNFIPAEVVKQINDQMVEKAEIIGEEWKTTMTHAIDWYTDKSGPVILQLRDIWAQASELIAPEYIIHPNECLLVFSEGDEMFIHSDSPGEEMASELTQHDRWNTCCVLHYGLCIYFGDFEGGEVFYPNISSEGVVVGLEGNEKCLEVPVEPGDLVIHGALEDYAHGVRKVTKGSRYTFSNFVLPKEKNPGTFPNYGTPENAERNKGIRFDDWNISAPEGTFTETNNRH